MPKVVEHKIEPHELRDGLHGVSLKIPHIVYQAFYGFSFEQTHILDKKSIF